MEAIYDVVKISGLGSATVYAQRIRSTDELNIPNDQVIPLLDFF